MSVSVNEFLRGVGESGLLPETVAAAFRGTLPDDVKNDARRLARALVDAGKLTKYQAAAIYQGRPQGLVLGNYVVLEKLGAGGMGQVFKARHTRMDRIVALKVLSRKQTASPDAVKRFHREVRAAARLNHPNIVTAHDADESDGQHYLVMEYVDGQDLASLVDQRGPLPVNEALDYVIQAAKGLQYAHEQGIIHRDIKPGNILLDRDGTAKVLDMGLAHNRFGDHPDDEAMAGEDLTQTGQIMGTVNYMAPEQAVDTRSADARADIYSLGCTLYRLLTGDVPFRADTTMKILVAHREEPIPSLRAERAEVPLALDTVFQKMMAKQPDERYQTMAEAVVALEETFAGEATLAPPPIPAAPKPPPPVAPSAADPLLSRVPVPPAPPQPPIATPPAASTAWSTAIAAPTRPTAAPARPRADVQRETINIHVDDDTNPHVFQRRASGRRRRWLLMPYLFIGGGVVAVLLLLGLAVVLLGQKNEGVLDGGGEATLERTTLTEGPTTAAAIPSDERLSVDADETVRDDAPDATDPNVLTPEERNAGWKLLFNGRTTIGWQGEGGIQVPPNWTVRDGALYCFGNKGPMLETKESFADFELQFQWRISLGGNSGVFYRGGYEYQLLDDDRHPNGQLPETSAGAIYGIVAPTNAKLRPVGEYNDARIVVIGTSIEHWLNGITVVDQPRIKKRIAHRRFQREPTGPIALQDHGHEVWLRGIKIRLLN